MILSLWQTQTIDLSTRIFIQLVNMVAFKVFRGTKDGIKEEKVERSVGPDEVLVKITHSGLCGTDSHYKAAGIVLGHEGIGLVEQVGEKVTRFKK